MQLFASGLHTDDHFFTSETDGTNEAGVGGGGGGSLASGSVHSVASRRDIRSATDGLSLSSKKVSKGGGIFGNRVNASEQARDVERMNAEVSWLCWPGPGRGGGRQHHLFRLRQEFLRFSKPFVGGLSL